MSGLFDIYSLIFLVVAVVIFMRLGSVLGRRTGQPTSLDRGPARPAPVARDNVIELPVRERVAEVPANIPDMRMIDRYSPPGTPLHGGLLAVAKASPGFDLDHFLEGAKGAYEIIVSAFAAGDRDVLRDLLASDVFEGFSAAIAQREAEHQTTELTFMGFEEYKITGAELDLREARLQVTFVTHLVSVTRNQAGEIVEGDPTEAQTIHDSWTFARNVDSRDPNWKLVATQAG